MLPNKVRGCDVTLEQSTPQSRLNHHHQKESPPSHVCDSRSQLVMFGNSPSLKIVLDEHLFFLHPWAHSFVGSTPQHNHLPNDHYPRRPSGEDNVVDDLVVQGSLNLSLAKSRKIKRLVVRIICDHAVYTGQDFR